MNAPISEEDLHAYADNRLAAERATAVEAWLATHPEHRAQVEAWRTQSAQLHRLYDPVLAEPVPARLIPPAERTSAFAWRHAAVVAWLALGGVIGFFLRGELQPAPPAATAQAGPALPRLAAVAHAVYAPEVRHPVEVGAEQEAHLVAWLSKRLGQPVSIPSLQAAGYRLVGGRLLPGESGEVAQFMFENEARSRLTLYVQPGGTAASDSAFRYARENGIDVFYWVDRRFGYALSGNIGREDMLNLATLIYRQLAP